MARCFGPAPSTNNILCFGESAKVEIECDILRIRDKVVTDRSAMKFGAIGPLVIMVLVMACGSITIQLDTEVADENDITHDMLLEASGQIATMMGDESDSGEFPEEWTSSIGIERIEIKCSHLSQSELAQNEIDGSGFADV